MYKILIALLLLISVGLQANSEASHEQLRQLLRSLEESVNSGKYEDLPQYFHPDMTITMSNQEVLRSPEDIASFFAFWFGDGGKLEKVQMKMTPDALTKFYADDKIGIVTGKGVENTYLTDSRFFPMETRWSATVIRGDDAKWRVLSLHMGVDFLDNPVMSMIEGSSKKIAMISGGAGLFFGLLAGFLIWRKKGRK